MKPRTSLSTPRARLLRSLARPGAALSPVNILVVDDDLELCTMLSRFLEMHGFTVYSASDALQALDVLERNQVSMVITDYVMPHMERHPVQRRCSRRTPASRASRCC
ncbi:response regulator [Halomonas halophila]|uniref:response regulator n=1 Tax=Halomonas halophila TaxID=29573 RepID=UPI003636925E